MTRSTATSPKARRRVGAIVGFLVFLELSSGTVQGFYLPLVSAIADQHHVSAADITWFVTVQTLAAAVCVPLLSKLGDMFGHRRILRLAVIAVAIGVVLVAIAPTFPLLLLGRVLIGPLAVWLPLEIALIHNRLEGDDKRRGVGLLVAFLTGGGLLGAVLAGVSSAVVPSLVLTLFIPVVIMAVCVLIVYTKIPESTERSAPTIDYIGFISLAVVLLALLGGLGAAQQQGFTSPITWLPLLVSIGGAVFWVLWEKRARAPMVDIHLLASRRLWPAYAASFLVGIMIFGTQTIGTTFLASDPAVMGYGFALSPLAISFFSILATALSVVGAILVAPLARRVGLLVLMIGAAAAASVSQLVTIVGHDLLVAYVAASVISGLAIGLLMGGLPSIVAEQAPADQKGITAGLYNTSKAVGGAVAGATFAVVLAAFLRPATGQPDIQGYIVVWSICGGAFLAAALILALSPRARDRIAQTSGDVPVAP